MFNFCVCIGDNISKKLEEKLDTECIHTITQEDNNSVLSLVSNEKYIFSGSQGSKIHVMYTFLLYFILSNSIVKRYGILLHFN
jgi:hypothetical protein